MGRTPPLLTSNARQEPGPTDTFSATEAAKFKLLHASLANRVQEGKEFIHRMRKTFHEELHRTIEEAMASHARQCSC